MKVTPVASPASVSQAPDASQPSARERAIAKLTAAPTTGQAQETPVANPNSISAEELSAVKAPSLSEAVEAQASEQEEQVPETAPEKPKVDTKASQEWAKLARQERQLRAKAQEQEAKFKQREAQLQAREAEAQSKADIYQKGYVSIEDIKRDILGVAEKAGLTYDEIANQMMNPTKIDPRLQSTIDSLKAEINELKKGTTEANERMTRQQQDSYNAAVKQIEMDTRKLVSSDPNFETIKTTGSVKDVVELITKTYEKDGVLLTVEEAANEVENYLIDEAMKLTRIEKIKRKLNTTANSGKAQKTAQTADTKADAQPQMKTLTNTVASSRKLSARERALLAFRNELK
jgi:hypothetical protein